MLWKLVMRYYFGRASLRVLVVSAQGNKLQYDLRNRDPRDLQSSALDKLFRSV